MLFVVSDESTDGTDEAVAGIDDHRVELIRQIPRSGKTAALNLAMKSIQSDIVVFSDANSIYSPDAIRNLVRNFESDNVGYVSGKLIYGTGDGNAVGDGCSTYMRFENAVRTNETAMGSVVGVDGGIDAVRRKLYDNMNADQLPDFVLPLKIRKKGYRVVFEPDARLVEDALEAGSEEFRMRVRVSLRALWALKDLSALLNPLRFGLFSIQLWSHKVLRYLAVVPLFLLPILSLLLIEESWFYVVAFWAQIVFYGVAASVPILGEFTKVQTIPFYFTLVNIASGVCTGLSFITGQKQIMWQPRLGA